MSDAAAPAATAAAAAPKKGPPKFAPMKGVAVVKVAPTEFVQPPPTTTATIVATPSATAIVPLFKRTAATRKRSPIAAAPPAVAAPAPVPTKTRKLPPTRGVAVAAAAAAGYGSLAPAAVAILDEETRNPYVLKPTPPAFVPTTRRGFSESIQRIFRPFILPPPGEIDYDACAKMMGSAGQVRTEMYLYQQFIREYVRQAAPYRGLLVYHGLGSGKTCSSIAAAEALLTMNKKKIVVMTPFSLRKNFIKEIFFCGFQQYRLQNYWEAVPRNETVSLFAREILGLPEKFIKKSVRIWVPDFSKQSNYKSLAATEQTEIRGQIVAAIDNRITFINYNGIQAGTLKEYACRQQGNRPFDNAVVIIDEIHNLIRLMQGTIDPYLTAIAAKKQRKIKPEPVEVGPWAPHLCGKAANYKRGYLFYRLLLDAHNSKIIGLSGTPLINFPEEIAILANVLHGYLFLADGEIRTTSAAGTGAAADEIEALGRKQPHIDFVRARPTGTGFIVTLTQLPFGYRKRFSASGEEEGVEPIGESEPKPTLKEVAAQFKAVLARADFSLTGDWKFSAEPLLPPFGEPFRDTFIDKTTGEIRNRYVLNKRLTGLISYYKGSKKELMPEVVRDEVVRVPMSIFTAKEYSRVRSDEITVEEKKKKKEGEFTGVQQKTADIWAEVYGLAGKKQTSNYRMSSRQACNFIFPTGITRPRPRNQREVEQETGVDQPDMITGDILPTLREDDVMELDGTTEAEDVAAVAAAEAEDAALDEDAVAAAAPTAAKGPIFRSPLPVVGTRILPIAGDGRCFFRAALVSAQQPATDADVEEFVHKVTAELRKAPASEKLQLFTNLYAPSSISTEDESNYEKEGDDVYKRKADTYETNDFENKAFREGHISRINKTDMSVKYYKLSYSKYLDMMDDGTVWPDPEFDNTAETVATLLDASLGIYSLQGDAYSLSLSVLRPASERKLTLLYNGTDHYDVLVLPTVAPTPQPAPLAAATIAEKRAQEKDACLKGLQPDEDYTTAIVRSKQCLRKYAVASLRGERLAETSAKYAAMIKNILASPGSNLVYSQFLEMEGLGIFSICMEANGFEPIEIVIVDGKPRFTERTRKSLLRNAVEGTAAPLVNRFIKFTGAENEEIRRYSLDIFNARFNELPTYLKDVLTEAKFEDNKLGQLCRVFCITSAGAEGLSLKNVRRVHIMESYWNDVRLMQVKGRAIRICSHMELPLEQRNVEIFTYLSCFPQEMQDARVGDLRIDETIRNKDALSLKELRTAKVPLPVWLQDITSDTYVMTSDEHLYFISERKKHVLDSLLTIMKETAVDCRLNTYDNEDGSYHCLSLKGKVGDFLYHPRLADDLAETAVEVRETAPAATAPAASAAAKPTQTVKLFNIKGRKLLAVPVKAEGVVVSYDLYDYADRRLTKQVGTIAATADGKPTGTATFM